MLKFYPSHTNLTNRFRHLCSQHFGIMESQLLMAAQSPHSPRLAMCSSNMPSYHKLVVHEHAEMSYHLSGYGDYLEEAMIRLLGEGIERYALVIGASLTARRIFHASYNDLKSESNVLPWELMNIYTADDYAKMNGKLAVQPITPDDEISWMWCPSLFDPGKDICIPAQMLFTGLRAGADLKEKLFVPGFSKGSAAHTDSKKALKAAILEAIEADAFMINWYTKRKSRQVVLDDMTLINIMSDFLNGLDFEVIPYEYTMPDTPAYVFALGMLHRKDERPVVLLGCSAGLDPARAIYRSLVEALAIHYLASNGPVVAPNFYLDTVREKDYTNLDSNVAYWAERSNADDKRAFMRSLVSGQVALSGLKNLASSDDADLGYLIDGLRDVSSYGVYLDITPPEVVDAGWKVQRVFFPELVQMSLPAFPYSGHPRLKQYGGVQNELPHPAP